MTATDTAQPERVEGWGGIAGYLDVSVRTVQEWAHRNVDCLPVFVGPTRAVWAFATALRDWRLRNSMIPVGARYVGDVDVSKIRRPRKERDAGVASASRLRRT